MSRETILAEISYERTYQQGKYGDSKDDTYMTPDQWVADITQYATRWRPGTYLPHSAIVVDDFRANMVKVAALAVAAIESLDRQRHADGSAFYEQPVLKPVPEHLPNEVHDPRHCSACHIAEQERRYSAEGAQGPALDDVVTNGIMSGSDPI